MCGINGFNFSEQNLIEKMNDVTRHRGPDATDFFIDERISLGHNRLSIIDLDESANQPMHSDDGRYIIIFNGEIYNYLDLKEKLLEGYSFKTKSDTEVILAAYKKWGNECISRLNGIFAFAIWDRQESKLLIARDFSGVKPLYYYWDGKKFIFSSEIKAILEHGMERKLDIDAFNLYLRVSYVPEPYTLFSNIKKLPPAHYLSLEGSHMEIKKYEIFHSEDTFSAPKTVSPAFLRAAVQRSVERQMVSDKPVGLYLSGGIDSSAILDCTSRVRDNIDTFSVGFDLDGHPKTYKFNADFELARRTANYYNTNHNEVMITVQDVVDIFEKAVWHLDEPISNPTVLPMYVLAKFAKKKVDVVLTGDGADELFGGYPRYHLSLLSTYYQKSPAMMRDLIDKHLGIDKLAKLNIPAGVNRFALFLFLKDRELKHTIHDTFFHRDFAYSFFKKKFFQEEKYDDFEKHLMGVDQQSWLVDESLLRGDKMSMSFGLEARVPFLDKELIFLADNIRTNQKVRLFDKKVLLKKAFKGSLPDFLINQPKRGWQSPNSKWLRQEKMVAFAREILSDTYHPKTNDLFDLREIRKMLDSHISGDFHSYMLWMIMSFQIWAKQFDVSL